MAVWQEPDILAPPVPHGQIRPVYNHMPCTRSISIACRYDVQSYQILDQVRLTHPIASNQGFANVWTTQANSWPHPDSTACPTYTSTFLFHLQASLQPQQQGNTWKTPGPAFHPPLTNARTNLGMAQP
ncbi:expressed unknown protein [Seminavis robusta]|uniref:Uncharacterized protein n=1 Tax=Seminavis robusta TaxID=568900 RepID=A0A9N8DIL8_9STRA|nr:expressed unknown protein [Seminavis robusta]|eukprot:Sro147_g067751.1  (128) ;mRNA; r:32564-32947